MWIFRRIANVMHDAVLTAIEAIVGTTCDVNGIDEAVFAEGIGKVPEGFFVVGGDEVELVADAANGATFHLAVQEETAGDGAIADEDELTEERTASLLDEVFHLLASGDTDDAVVAQHGHIAKA